MWATEAHGILTHPSDPEVWLAAGFAGYRLPGFTHKHVERVHLPNQFDGALIPGFREVFGCDVYVLKTVSECEDASSRRARLVCLLELRSGQPANGKWVASRSITPESFGLTEHYQSVRETLIEIEENSTLPGCPWERRGWFPQAVHWIERELPRLGRGSVTHVQQRRATGNSAILRTRTHQGAFYFKAVADVPWLANEPVIATALSSRYPHLVPEPVAVDADRRWMLTAEFGNPLEDFNRDRDLILRAASEFGRMQLDAARSASELLPTDPFGFDLARLPGQLERLFTERADSLDASELEALHEQMPRWREYIDRLEESAVPQTILHGDFTPANMARREDRPIIFDWDHRLCELPVLRCDRAASTGYDPGLLPATLPRGSVRCKASSSLNICRCGQSAPRCRDSRSCGRWLSRWGFCS